MGSTSWLKDGERYTSIESNKEGATEIVAYTARDNTRQVLVPDSLLINPISTYLILIHSLLLLS